MTRLYTLLTAIAAFLCASGVMAQAPDLFAGDSVLRIRLSGNVRALMNDRSADADYHPLSLTYTEAGNRETTLRLRGKTRGNFRLKRANCAYPPILLNFRKKETGASLFEGQDKLKLVMPCQGEKYVIREYLVYKLYNLLTPESFRARLVEVTFDDTVRNKELKLMGILLEEDEQMAVRNGTDIQKRTMLKGENTEAGAFLKMAMFQYMIGNTDWSVPYLHNIRLVSTDSAAIPRVVPYDFDHAGIVNAPYAHPTEALELSSVMERRYRGYCISDISVLDELVATFNRLKVEFYKVYTDCSLLDGQYKNATLRYLDGFYEVINNPKKLGYEFSYPCRLKEEIVIKGLAKEEG